MAIGHHGGINLLSFCMFLYSLLHEIRKIVKPSVLGVMKVFRLGHELGKQMEPALLQCIWYLDYKLANTKT